MKFRHPLFKILIHFFVFIKPLSEHGIVYRLTSRHDKPGIVFCNLKNKSCAVLIKMVLFHPAEKVGSAHARQNDSVFDFTIADFPRREKRI